MWNRVLGSTCGMSFCFCGCVYCWEVNFFVSPGPNIFSCNPTSFKLDTGLQPTVSLFGYSISLFCLCELSHVVFMVLSFHFPTPPSCERPHQVRVGVVESSCNTPSVCCNLQIKNV